MHKGMATIGDACQLFWLRKYGGVIKDKVHCRRFQVKDVGSSYTIKTYTYRSEIVKVVFTKLLSHF